MGLPFTTFWIRCWNGEIWLTGLCWLQGQNASFEETLKIKDIIRNVNLWLDEEDF